MKQRVFIRRESVWLAWYPMRRLRSQFGFEDCSNTTGGWYFSAALGPLYFGLGPGRLSP